jgi:hypothetical protein
LLLQPDTQEEAPAGAAVAGLLQLAMNNSIHAAAEAAAYHIPAQLQLEVVHKLLTTAALRQHVSAVQHMAGLAVMRQHADAAALQSCLQELLAPLSLLYGGSIWHDYFPYSNGTAPQHKYNQLQRSVCVRAACTMPAAALLGTDAVLQLLLAAVPARAHMKVISKLCRLPAARQLSSDQALQILDVAIKLQWTSCTFALCSWLPAANHLEAHLLAQLFRTAVDFHSKHCVELLCRLPGARQISSDVLLQLLKPAVEHGCRLVRYSRPLPAAAGISKEDRCKGAVAACF